MHSTAMCWPSTPAAGRWAAVMMMLLSALFFIAPDARAQSDDANNILKAMSDYLASQKSISLSFDTDIEVITPYVQKIQFASSGRVRTRSVPPGQVAMPMSSSFSTARRPPCTQSTSTRSLRLMRPVRLISLSIG